MKYDELDQRAKDKAKIAWENGETDTGWWDSVYEDAVACARCLGIEIGEKFNRTVGCQPLPSYEISFSGFWSQGDGCSFSGWLRMAEMFEATKDVKEHAPQDKELMALAVRAEALHADFTAILVSDRLSDEPLYPEYTAQTAFVIKGESHRGFSTRIDDTNNNGIPEEFEKDCDSFVEDFASWIYDQLEKEHEYLTSDERFDEWLAEDDPEFDEDGDLE